jgi:hypothetical protein
LSFNEIKTIELRKSFKPTHFKCRLKLSSLFTSSSLAKGYDPLYSFLPLASLDGFLRSHGDGLCVMQLVVAATNQNALYTKAHVL